MDPRRAPVMAGNWKMHKGIHETGGFLRELTTGLKPLDPLTTEVVVAPVFTSLTVAQQATWGSPVRIAAQNCHWADQGAFTGEVSAAMIKEVGISHVILGHSERRQYFGETDETVAQRLQAVLAESLVPILCIGESLQERESDQTETVLARQLSVALADIATEALASLIIAYEPVWAIGTGKVATTDQAQATHAFIRAWLSERAGAEFSDHCRILYGGSAKPGNVAELLACPDVDGCLIGGASLDEKAFMAMIATAEERLTSPNGQT